MTDSEAAHVPVAGWRRWLAGVLLGLVALNAVAAGFSFVVDPEGSGLGIPREWLDGTPFSSYAIPGLILFLLGLLYGYSAYREFARTTDAWFWAGLSGGAMIVWIVVQAILMGYDRHPVQTLLQAVILSIGAIVGVLAWSQWRDRRPKHDPRSEENGKHNTDRVE